jgi:hypothetical protein
MADTFTHALLGGAGMSLISKKKWLKIVLFVAGLLTGAWPDAIPWLLYQMGEVDRWALYNVYHHSWTWMDALPPFGLHILIDLPWHSASGQWSLFGVIAEVPLALFALFLFWYSFWIRTEKESP